MTEKQAQFDADRSRLHQQLAEGATELQELRSSCATTKMLLEIQELKVSEAKAEVCTARAEVEASRAEMSAMLARVRAEKAEEEGEGEGAEEEEEDDK